MHSGGKARQHQGQEEARGYSDMEANLSLSEEDSPDEDEAEDLDEDAAVENTWNDLKQLSDTREEERLDKLLLKASTGSEVSKPQKTLHYLSQLLLISFTKSQKVSLLRDFVESEFFVIDGDSLMMTYIHETTLVPGQNLHFFYLVENFLFDLTEKKAKFVITFFKDAESIWNQSPLYLSVRTALILHLQHNTKVPVLTNFSNCFDPKWKQFLNENHPYFVMISDKAFTSSWSGKCASGMFQIFMFHALGNKINVVLSSGMSWDVLRVYAYHVCSKSTMRSKFKTYEVDLKVTHEWLVQVAPSIYDQVFCTPNKEKLAKQMQKEIQHSFSKLKDLWPQGSDISRILCVVSCSVALKMYAHELMMFGLPTKSGETAETQKERCSELAIQSAADICRMYCLHVALLRNLPLSDRALKKDAPWTDFAHRFLLLRRTAEYFILKKLLGAGWKIDMTYLSDLNDGRLLRTVAKLCSEKSRCTDTEDQLGSKIGGEYKHIWETVAKTSPELNVGHAFPVTCTSMIFLKPTEPKDASRQKIPASGLIPMKSTLVEEFIGDLLEQLPQLNSEDLEHEPQYKLKEFDEVLHWHSRKHIVSTLKGHHENMKEAMRDPKKWGKLLRNEQKLVAHERLYAESLDENAAVTIVTSPSVVTKDSAKQQHQPRKGNSSKPAKKKSSELIIEAQEKKKKEEEERKAQERWSSLQDSIQKELSNDIDKGIKSLEKFLQNCTSDNVKVTAEMEASKYCYKAWVEHCRSKGTSRDVKIAVLLMRRIHSILNRHEVQLSPTVLNELARYLKNLGFLNLRETVLEMIDTEQKREMKIKSMKDPKFPVGVGAARFQLQHMGPYLFREERKDPDPRVRHFIPDSWQRELLDAVDNNESAVIVAPTSSGKTYASYYCMEKVLRGSNTGIVVYVSPTKALVNQVVATVYGRFTKSLPNGMVVCGCFTRDYHHHIHDCQILVTVPQCLEILLLSPHLQDWVNRIQYVIFDEVHCLGGEIGAEVWEHLLALIRCPFLALSATISNPEDLTQWLQSVKMYWQRVENSSDIPASTKVHQKSKKSQKTEAYESRQSFKVRLVTYEERYNDLEKFLCDFENNKYKLIPYHPCAALTVKHIQDYGIPSDLALTPSECLRLYDAMVFVFPKWPRAQEFEPEEYKSFKNKVIIRKSDVREYEADLKKEFAGWLEAGWKDKAEGVLLLLNPEAERTFQDSEKRNFPLLVETLQKMDLLPALFFAFDIDLVERFAGELLVHLLEKAKSKRKPNDMKEKQKLENKLRKLSKHLEKEDTSTDLTRKQSEQLVLYRTEYNTLEQKYRKLCELPPGCTFAEISTTDEQFRNKIFFRMRKANFSGHFRAMLMRGIGCHHGSLNNRIKQTVEMLFRRGYIKVVSSTSTLALGINMPCKTTVFLQDSVHLDSLSYRQMSGRAGRRGMDNLGKVIFLNVPLPKVQRLIKANVPQLKGQFPLSITFVLRLMLLAARADDKIDAQAKVLSALQHSMMTFNQPKKQNIVKFYFLFSLQFLLREGHLDQECQPQGFAGLVMHIHYHEPANFVFIHFLVEGLLHKICRPLKRNSKLFSEDVMETLVLILANLFGRRYLPPCLEEENLTFDQSKIIFRTLGIHTNNIPVLQLKCFDRQGRRMPLNAYALDFYKHGCLDALHTDNGLNRGEAFNLIKDFTLVIASISTSLEDLCDNEDDPVILAFQQLHRNYKSKFENVWS
ncbi:probable ATP-dependent RNA helicase DDX60 [Rhincodon typus]|uniref:probable ATP-dependent RNA helicase DDX60 n=1 Tax=Rhincodon typus TaxID=259920 RepID=UPI002030F1CA|nr:probable ATP-dependent RNA helicase DDX60 [Rhincodon typus]